MPWLLVENKGVTGTIHYRLAPDQIAAAALLEPLARAAATRHGLRLTLGRMIFEVRPALAVNKGTAIRELAQDLGLRGIVFFGDDVTDVDAFRALRELREAGEAATLRVGVLGPETSPTVLAEIDVSVEWRRRLRGDPSRARRASSGGGRRRAGRGPGVLQTSKRPARPGRTE